MEYLLAFVYHESKPNVGKCSRHGGIMGIFVWVFPKIGVFPPKMDGENNGKTY